MRVLVFGGTGAMGKYLVDLLAKRGDKVFVTSRQRITTDNDNVVYIQGNAHDRVFLESILFERYDAIIDFMVYKKEEFEQRYEKLLNSTNHYIFLSSCRVYSDSANPITEETERILDVCTDEEYLMTDEYALSKARQENLLIQSARKNWTVIRPYITYNPERLQLGTFEKEQWLQRVLMGKTIVFPREVAEKTTAMTSGFNVAEIMLELIGNKNAMGECVQIVTFETKTWKEILDIYCGVLEDVTGSKVKILLIENNTVIPRILKNQYQLKYDRLYNRSFDSHKVCGLCGKDFEYFSIKKGLEDTLKEFLTDNKKFKRKSWELDAYMDKVAGERTSLKYIPTMKEKIKYIIARYTPYFSIVYRRQR